MSLRAAAAVVLLVAIAALGGWLRFSHAERMGPYLIDDGYFALEGQFLYTTAKAIGESAGRWVEERKSGVDLWKREPEIERVKREIGSLVDIPKLAYARPLTSLSVAVAMAFLGGPAPHAGAFMAAFYGTLTIPAVFFLLWRTDGARAGLYGALLLAASGMHVMYSRAGLAEAPSVFFLTLSMAFYLLSLQVPADRSLLRAFAAGVFWGLGIAAQDRWLIMSGLLWASEAYLWLRTRGRKDFPFGLRAARVASIAFGMAAAMALFELPYYGAMIALRNLGAALP
ncbi:MAG: hypothetical protein K8I02_06875, partial [Candidatus Methylomirabilis sp.]|nr:hypothetical protein [Deltaproteobacteria bacterium]